MIDFRYHLVSIIAVFLALAIGIVVGTTALNGYVVDDLRARNGKVIQDKRALEGTVRDLRRQVSRRDEFAREVAPQVVAGQLTGERVLVVTAPGASDSVVTDLTARIAQAGGATTGQLRLNADLFDPAKSSVVDDVVARVAPAGLPLPGGATSERAALELAAAVVTGPGPIGMTSDAAAKIIGGFTGAQLIDVRATGGGSSLARANLALVVTGGTDGQQLDDASKSRQQALLALVRSLEARSSGAVVVGPESAAGAGGVLAALRTDGALRDAVSSVDTVDTTFGGVSTILALHEQQAGRPGRYGQGPGSQAAAPTLPPR
ncbi:MAG: copper transporter [Mycobacteriales bacterium]